jgi:hypothetical protein
MFDHMSHVSVTVWTGMDINGALHRATPCHWLMPHGLRQFPKTLLADRLDKALEPTPKNSQYVE